MAKYRIVVTDNRFDHYEEETAVLRQIDGEIAVNNCSSATEVSAAVTEADAVLCNLAPMPASVIESMRKCRVISRYGVGYDNIDVPAATARGIWVTNVPDYCLEDVSDHALALLFACVRRVTKLDHEVRHGQWNIAPRESIHRMQGRNYGFIGYGLIARALHRKLSGFGLGRVLVFDPFVGEGVIRAANAVKADLEEVCREADFVSIHVPLTGQTRGLIGKKQLDWMKPTAILVNVSRGPVVDEIVLIDALRHRRLLMAGLDVFEREPPDPDHPLFKSDHVVLSDHSAYFSVESISELKTKAACNVSAVLNGRMPPYAVNQPLPR